MFNQMRKTIIIYTSCGSEIKKAGIIMKILWLTNLRLPIIDSILRKNVNYFGGGWLSGLLNQILKTTNEIVLCYPEYEEADIVRGVDSQVSFYGFPIDARKSRLGICNIQRLKKFFDNILDETNPDVIHIHGTEFQFSYAMAIAAKEKGLIDRVALSIQGMTSVYAHHFFGNLPRNYTPVPTLKEILIQDGARNRYKSFVRRGKYEIKTIKLVKHVLGRTSWDYINCVSINPDITYHKSNETLRKSFYSDIWRYEAAIPYTVFVSQAGTILKSFHMVLEALAVVKRFYPKVKVKVAGPRIIEGNWIKGNSYGIYLRTRICDLGLEENVEFLGPQNECQMKGNMLKANVFVLPSSIENSPNSLGEAMLLGMPCISSDVGGVSDLIKHNEEGYIYPADAPDMLAYYIMKVFQDKENAEAYGKKARNHAILTHDPEKNWKELNGIYYDLLGEKCGKFCGN